MWRALLKERADALFGVAGQQVLDHDAGGVVIRFSKRHLGLTVEGGDHRLVARDNGPHQCGTAPHRFFEECAATIGVPPARGHLLEIMTRAKCGGARQ
jgi:hypothetical protein